MSEHTFKNLAYIRDELAATLDSQASRASKAMSLLKLFEEKNILYRLGTAIDDIEYDKVFTDEKDPRIEKYEQILSIMIGDCQPKG